VALSSAGKTERKKAASSGSDVVSGLRKIKRTAETMQMIKYSPHKPDSRIGVSIAH
jgi:hypothetical protein